MTTEHHDPSDPTRARVPDCAAGGVDHEALYAAERAAFDGTDLEQVVPFAELRARSDDLLCGGWWPGPPVVVKAARSDARSSRSVSTAAGVELRLAASQFTVATLAHELAHALAGLDDRHGSTYRRALLDVVEVLTNLDPTDRRSTLHVEQLAQAFVDADLAVGERQWPAPPASCSGAIAL